MTSQPGSRGAEPRRCIQHQRSVRCVAVRLLIIAVVLLAWPCAISAQRLTTAGRPAQLDVRVAGDRSIRVTLSPIDVAGSLPETPAVADRSYPAPALSLREISEAGEAGGGQLRRRGAAPAVDARRPRRRQARAGADLRGRRHAVVQAGRSAGARHGRGWPAAGAGPTVARAAGAVRSPRPAGLDGAALAERHVRLAQSGRDAARHVRLGAVRRDPVGPGRSAPDGSRPLRSLAAVRAGPRAAERAEPAAEPRERVSRRSIESCRGCTTSSSSMRTIRRPR